MIRTTLRVLIRVIRVLLLVMLGLCIGYTAFLVPRFDQADLDRAILGDIYGSGRGDRQEESAPAAKVSDSDTATILVGQVSKCYSNEAIDYAKRGNLEAFGRCLRGGTDPWIIEAPPENKSYGNMPGTSALWFAAANGSLGIVKLLVDQYDVSPDWGGHQNNVPVVAAIQRSRFEVVTFLLDAGADTRRWSGGYVSALRAAAEKKESKYLRVVLDAGAFPNDITGNFVFHAIDLMITWRRYEHALMLVEHGACVGRGQAESLELEMESTRTDSERRAIGELLDTIRENYAPTCKRQAHHGQDYRWERERDGADVETARADP